MRGSVISHLAMTTFCWLPPGKRAGRNVGRAGADREQRRSSSATSFASRPRSTTPAREMRSSAAKRQVRRGPTSAASALRSCGPRGSAPCRSRATSPHAGSSARPARPRPGSRPRRRAARRTARAAARAAPARRARRARRLRRPATLKEMSLQPVRPAEVLHFEQRRPRSVRRGGGFGGKTWLYSRPIIISTTSSSVFVPAAIGRDVRAVAEHRAVVGEFGDLVHAVGDDRGAPAPRPAAASAPRTPWRRRPRSAPRSLRRG